jgi:addiction module RelB/DinJ family antitoxin
MASQMLHVRMDEGLKADGAALFHSMGLTESEAVRMFYKRAVLNHESFAANASDNSNNTASVSPDWSVFDGLFPNSNRIVSIEEMNEIIDKRRGERWSR